MTVHSIGDLRGHGRHGRSMRMAWIAGIALEHVGLMAELLLRGRRVVDLRLCLIVASHCTNKERWSTSIIRACAFQSF